MPKQTPHCPDDCSGVCHAGASCACPPPWRSSPVAAAQSGCCPVARQSHGPGARGVPASRVPRTAAASLPPPPSAGGAEGRRAQLLLPSAQGMHEACSLQGGQRLSAGGGLGPGGRKRHSVTPKAPGSPRPSRSPAGPARASSAATTALGLSSPQANKCWLWSRAGPLRGPCQAAQARLAAQRTQSCVPPLPS